MRRPPTSPVPGGRSQRELRSGVSLALATLTASLLSYAFNLILTRALGPEGFGAVGALLGVAVVGSVPATALQLEVARLVASGEATDARWLIGRAATAVSALSVVVGLALVPLIDRVLRLSTPWEAILLAALLFPQTLTGALMGLLLGRGRLGRFSVVLLSVGFARLLAAVATQIFHGGATFALGAAVLGAFASMVVGLLAVLGTGVGTVATPSPGARSFSMGLLRAAAGATALMILLNIDLLVARALLDDNDSGQYAFLTIFGRVTFWATSFLSLWAFPRVAGVAGARRAIRVSLAALTLSGLAAVIGSWLLRGQLVEVLAGPAYAESAPYVPAFALAGALISVVQLGTYVDVARARHQLTVAALIGALVIAAVAVLVGASSIWGIISIVNAVLALLTVLSLTRLRGGRAAATPPDLTTSAAVGPHA